MPVLSEIATMTEVAQGTSLARFGDGELLIIAGKDAAHQKYDERLFEELSGMPVCSPCLVGMPHARGLRKDYWQAFLKQYGLPDDRWYGSSFVSREDEVSWTEEYRSILSSMLEKTVPLVISSYDNPAHKFGDHIICVDENAYDQINDLEETASHYQDRLVILSCGPTATVLADRLARKGIWAVDLGNFGKFL